MDSGIFNPITFNEEACTGCNICMDVCLMEIHAANTLKRGIERLNEIKKNASFKAENPHELMRCLEVQSIIDNAEMVLNASLERRESRRAPFGFYRADFPEQNDKEWLAFLALKHKEEKFEFYRIPIKQ